MHFLLVCMYIGVSSNRKKTVRCWVFILTSIYIADFIYCELWMLRPWAINIRVCLFWITVASMKCHTFRNRHLAPNFILNLRKYLLKQNAEKILFIPPWVEHKPLIGIQLWKWSNSGSDLNIQVTHCEVRLETWCSKCAKSPMRSDGVWLTLCRRTTSKDIAQWAF